MLLTFRSGLFAKRPTGSPPGFAAQWYVGGPGASDSNNGLTEGTPFATIAAAAAVALAGDIVVLRAGVYRETVIPANSGTAGNPITFMNYPGEIVVVSGCNAIDTPWVLHDAGLNIYKTTKTLPVEGYNQTITNNTTIAANQIFKDGEMMFEARWPKLSSVADLMDRTKLRSRSSMVSFGSTSLTDNGLPTISGGYVGAKIWINGWYISGSRTVTSHSSQTLGYAAYSDSGSTGTKRRRYYYVTGKLGLLTAEKEWHYEDDTLYFRQPGGGVPTGVEYKARNWGFDLRGKSHITIEGIHFFGCDPAICDVTSDTIIIDGIKSLYMNHTFLQEGADQIYYNARQTGLRLIGPNSQVINSEFQYAASHCIWLGEDGLAHNNKIHDISYEGNYGAGIGFYENTAGAIITNNSIFRVGRSAIDFGYNELGSHLNVLIALNDIYNFGMHSVDLGGIYAARRIDLTGTIIRYNWIGDSLVTNDAEVEQLGINTGIYLDQASGPLLSHHNVLFRNVQSDIYTQPDYGGRNAGQSFWYNNVCATQGSPLGGGNRHSYKNSSPSPIDVQRNNIYRDDVIQMLGAVTPDVANSIMSGTNPLFVPSGTRGLGFRVQSGSPAIDAGVAIGGITDGYLGTNPDAGAYEFGGDEWVPGCDF